MFDDVYLVSDNLQLFKNAAIAVEEKKLGVRLPRGYHAFVTKLGNGTYCDRVWVVPPEKIQKETADLRKLVHEHFFWPRGEHVLTRSQLEEAFNIARSPDGDELIYLPDSEHRVYVLPRHDETIYWLSPEFEDPIAWHAETGPAMSVPPFRYFEPSRGRACVELFTSRRDHRLENIANTIDAALSSGGETRSIIDGTVQLHFHKAVGSRVQLVAVGDGRVSIRIVYDPRHKNTVAGCVVGLESAGFYVTGGHNR